MAGFGGNTIEITLIGEYDDKISANIAKTEAAVSKAMSAMKDAASGLWQGMKDIALGGGAVGAALGLVAREAAQSEDAQNKLNAALKASGQYSDETSKSLQDFATELQNQTKYSDEAIMSAESMMVQFGANEEQTKRATKAAVGLSSALGIDLNSASLLMAKAFEGNTATLGRYGIKVDEGLDSTEKFEAVLKQIEGKKFFDIAVAEAGTFTGSLAGLKNSFSDLMEIIGLQFTPVIAKVAKQMQEFVRSEEAAKWAREFGQQIGTIIQRLGEFLPTVLKTIGAIVQFAAEHKNLTMILAGGLAFRQAIGPLTTFGIEISKLAVNGIPVLINSVSQVTEKFNLLGAAAPTAVIAASTVAVIKAAQEWLKLRDAQVQYQQSAEGLAKTEEQLADTIFEKYGLALNTYRSITKELDNQILTARKLTDENAAQQRVYDAMWVSVEKIAKETGSYMIAWDTVGDLLSRHNIDLQKFQTGHQNILAIQQQQTIEQQKQLVLSDQQKQLVLDMQKSLAQMFASIADPSNYQSFLISFGQQLSQTVRTQILNALAQVAFSAEMLAPLFAQIQAVATQIREGLTPDFSGLQMAMDTVRSQFQAQIPLIQTTMQLYNELDKSMQQSMGVSWSLTDAKNKEKIATDIDAATAVDHAQKIANDAYATDKHTQALSVNEAVIYNTVRAFTVHNGAIYELTGNVNADRAAIIAHRAQIDANRGAISDSTGMLGRWTQNTNEASVRISMSSARASGGLDTVARAASQAAGSFSVFDQMSITSHKTTQDIMEELRGVSQLAWQWGSSILYSGKSIDQITKQVEDYYDVLIAQAGLGVGGYVQAFNLQHQFADIVILLRQLVAAMSSKPAAQHGLDFTVGGRGGTDRNLVAFRASRGEHVSVTPSGTGGMPSFVINIAPGAKVDRQTIRDELLPEILKALKRQYAVTLT